MKLLFNVLTAVAAVFPAIAAENGDTVFVDFGELDQSPPVFYNRQRTMPAIMSPQVNTSMAVGEIPFSESVTPSGGKIYNVPVAVSEESRLRPEVSLLYNSQGAEGAAGYGWSISGVSAISVVNMTLHYDGVASSPDLSDPDGCAFALDGVRLLEREDAADGFAFETAEGFVRARKVKSGGALTRFDVRYPDGRAAVFGFSDSYETSHIYPVTEITDPDGSKMFYDYIESGNTYYVSHIYYGGKDRAGCYGHVSFEYSDVSGFPASYVAGVEIKPGKILKKIVSSVKVNGAETELMHYDLTHSGDSWHFLTKISAGCGTETLNPLSFDYGYSGMDEGVLQLFSDKYLQTETTFTYQNNATASRYHVGLPLTKSVKRTRGGDQWMDKETYTYDAAGRPLTRVLHTGTSGTVEKEETRWTYDAWGNVLSEMSSPYGSGVFTGTAYAYDGSGRYLTEETDALGLTTTYSGFDKYGNPQSEEDFRGNVTAYTYDTFGRLTGKSLPTGAEQTVAFSWGGDGLYKVAVTESGKPDKVTEYDALGREVRSRTIRPDGQWQSVSRRYDSKGRLSGVSLPYSGASPEHWSVYSYDRFGRQTEAVEPSGSVTEWSYSGLTVTETSRGITKTTRKDASGAVREVTDPGGTILYSYRPDGQPWLMTAPDEIYTEITYDEAGRRKSIADPSAGLRTTSYAYSGGELTVTETDADGRAVATTYDKYGRKAKVVRPEFSTTYGYDGYGQLAMVMSDNGTSRNYIHDTFGRVMTETETVPGGRSLTKAYYYGDDGVPTGVLYAGGRVYHELLYTYSHGTLSEITLSGGGGTVWKLTEMNGMGMPTKVVTGDIQREYGYTDYGMPLYRKFGAHQHFAYDFDPHTGNLMSRTDALRGITEEYGYDGLNRLTDENGRETEYADNGSIVSRDGVGTATYNAAPNAYRLKELRLPDNADFYYQVSDISYTSFGRPDKIVYDRRNAVMDESGESIPTDRSLPRPPTATFTYNDRGERVMMVVKGNNGRSIACRYYIGGVYEVDEVTGEERLYIGGDAYTAPAVDICNADGEWELHFIGRDYLGSITHIADSKGNLVAEYSYDAWGRLRDPDTQELYGNSGVPDLLLWRGFTGHEWLPWFGLYNMNARLYDPVLGRFLSPDPYVQMPDNTQNLNRYLYALNNPFQYKDDSGEFLIALLVGALIGAGVSALTYSVATLVTGNSWSWQDFGKSVGIGAFGGALGGAAGWLGASCSALGSFGNSFGYNMVSQIANSTITNVVFGQGFDYNSLLGIATGALVGTMIPSYSAFNGSQFANGMAEIGYNTMRGAVTGLASGFVDSSLYGNPGLIWQNAVGGAISGGSRSILMNAIFGAPYYTSKSYGKEGLYRRGGLSSFVIKKMHREGGGLTMGRNMFTNTTNNEFVADANDLRYHENAHLQQQLHFGFSKFYYQIIKEYIRYGFNQSYDTPGTLEYNADEYEKTYVLTF